MRTLVLGVLVGLASTGVSARDALGTWLVQDQTAKVEIASCREHASWLCGDIVWLKAPLDESGRPKRDARNPDPALAMRPLVGLTVIRGLRPDGSGLWTGGTIYDPRTGRSYGSKLRLNPDGTLWVYGCLASFCRHAVWRPTT